MTRFAAAALLILAWPAHAQMYKCVDERGVVQLLRQAEPGLQGRARSTSSRSRRFPASAAPHPRTSPQQDADFKRRQIEREQAEAKDKAALRALRAAAPGAEPGSSGGTRVSQDQRCRGERVYIDDATRDARLAATEGSSCAAARDAAHVAVRARRRPGRARGRGAQRRRRHHPRARGLHAARAAAEGARAFAPGVRPLARGRRDRRGAHQPARDLRQRRPARRAGRAARRRHDVEGRVARAGALRSKRRPAARSSWCPTSKPPPA